MKYTTIYGIDVAKKTFDVSTIDGEHLQFANTEKGFQAFLKHISTTTLCVMEVIRFTNNNFAYNPILFLLFIRYKMKQ